MTGTVEARRFVTELLARGVTDVVVSPGSRSGPLARAVAAADAQGLLRLHVRIDGVAATLPVDTIVICAGQVPNRTLHADLAASGVSCHLIGGADVAAELDAKRAIDQGTRLAARL